MSIQISKLDDKLYKTLELLKLEIVKHGDGLNQNNFHSFVIRTMRHIEGYKKVTGSEKKEMVTNILLLLAQDYANDTLNIDARDIEESIEHMYNVGILAKKKCC